MTPLCTVCGYAVEWGREAYRSKWRLTEDPSVLTPGHFVFAPDITPFFPHWHNLWSGKWTSDDSPRSALGEVFEERRRFSRGIAPSPFPLAQVIGDAERMDYPCDIPGNCLEVVEADCGTTLPSVMYFQVVSTSGIFAPLADYKSAVTFGDFFGFDSWSVDTGLTMPFLGFPITVAFGCNAGYILFGIFDSSSGNGFQGIHPTGWNFANPAPVPLTYMMENFDFEPSVINVQVTFNNPSDLPEDPRKFIAGFDSRCFHPLPTVPDPTPVWPEITSLPDMLRLAKVSAHLYDSYAEAENYVQAWFGPDAVISGVDDSASIIPGYLVAVRGPDTYVCVSGTTNLDQVVFYCCYGATAPTNVGLFSTNLAWILAAHNVAAAISSAGADPTGRILIQGHSYGGAIAHLLAAIYLSANANRKVDLFTMGSPKVGDHRLVTLLTLARKVRLSDRGDIVCGAPPYIAEVIRCFPGIPLGLPAGFSIMRHCPGQIVLETDGALVFSDESVLDFSAITTIVNNALLNLPLTSGFPHSTSEYVRRLTLANQH